MPISRREWILASLCWSDLLAHAAPAVSALTTAEATAVRFLAAAILPETETPGSDQAGAVQFINAALAGYDHDQLDLYRHGLADLTARLRQTFPTSAGIADLTAAQRTALVKSIETTAFFDKLRTHTILAYFGNPQFGWKLLGRDPAMHFAPPFGFYDAEAAAG